MTSFLPLDRGWNFRRLPPAGGAAGAWTEADLPHCPFVADLDGREHWFGECEYQRTLQLPPGAPTGRCALYVGAAMHSAVVYVDGQEVGRHAGGFLPFEIDLTATLRDGGPHVLVIRLDNRDNADVPPGKPYADLDFCWYGGLYRGAELRCYPAVHVTDPVAAGEPAGGGIFIRTLAASPESATISVRTHVRNAAASAQGVRLEVEVLQGAQVVARAAHPGLALPAESSVAAELTLEIARPRLWQPDSPALHHARVTLRSPAGEVVDRRTERFGIRRIAFSRSGGFTINGRRRRLRGTNRHQEYPYVGYAAPRAAQHRDARLIKEAGFDYVRLSHYPQSLHFLDACDELGIVVMNCIPGWQFIGGEIFRATARQNARDLVRRDRNHPSVVLWELSLNETEMDEAFMRQLHAIGHEEYPGDQMFTCGWQDHYDVFVHSRQHGEIHRWRNGDKALAIAEYGDWEFYASSAGFDQKTGAGVYASWGNSRARRQDGERRLRQQAANHMLALNDTLSSPAVLDGQWAMFDYARGYDTRRAACGTMDIFRLPKFSYYFYRSQRDPAEQGANWTGGPMIHIASHWTPVSDLRVLVFSNCDEVELRLNGAVVGRSRAAKAWMTQDLPHPPWVFELPAFLPGALEATGFIGGRPAASHHVATPGAPAQLELEIDSGGVFANVDETDVLIAHARILDPLGTLCVGEAVPVTFLVGGGAQFIGPSTIVAEAGVASVVLRLPAAGVSVNLQAACTVPAGALSVSLTWRQPSPHEPADHEAAAPVFVSASK